MFRSIFQTPNLWGKRPWKVGFVGIALLSLLAFFLPAAQTRAESAPFQVFAEDALPTFTYKEHNIVQPGSSNLKIVPVTGRAFTQALEATSPAGFELPNDESSTYQITAQAPTVATVKQNDVLEAKFWLRQVSSSTGQAQLTVSFQRSSGDYAKSLQRHINPPTDWKQYTFTFRSGDTFAPGEAEFTLWLGYNPPQTIAIGGFSVKDLGPDATVPAYTYEGREADAAWRVAANQRIEQNRKSNLNIVVRDQAGNTLPDASVHVQMLNHAFNFGTAVDGFKIADTSNDANNQRYREKLVQTFNMGVTENDLKWPEWEDRGWRNYTEPEIQWLWENGLKVRGTNFVWSTPWNPLIGDESSLISDPQALSNRIDNHILNEAGEVRGKIVDWDVVNELFWGPTWLNKLGGSDAVAHWLKLAREADPKAHLTLNDFYFLNNDGSIDTVEFNYYKKLVQDLKLQDAPIDRIGIESHFSPDGLASPEQMIYLLDQIAAWGVTPQITEFDLPTTDQQLQADYTRDMLIAAFSDPNVDTFITWGFWDGHIWQPNAGQYDANWNLKPNGRAWQDLLYHQWWTDVTGTTSAQGKYSTRGFQGDYQIDVTVNGKTNRVKTTLGKGTRNLSITFNPTAPTPPVTQPKWLQTPTPAATPLPTSFVPDRGSVLLGNGDIEQGTQNWSTFGGSPFSATQSPVHGGSNALLSSGRQAFWQGPAQTVSLKNGATYSSSVWARLAPGSVPATVTVTAKVQTSTNPDGLYFGLGSAQVTADGWTQITGNAQLSWTGDLSAAYWWVSTAWDSPLVDFYIDDASLQGPPTARTVIANHTQWIDGTINGSLQQLQVSDITIDSTASVTRGLYVPGAPLIRPNGAPLLTTELPATGTTTPTDKVITVNGKGRLDYVISRTDPYTLTPVPEPALPTGINDVVITRSGQSFGDPAALRDLTLRSNVGEVSVPGGTYGVFVVNAGSTLTLGTAGATTPTVYNLQGLKVNPGATLKVLGPVVLNIGYGAALNGTVGSAAHPFWLVVNVSQEGVGINGQQVYALVNAPTTEVTVNGKITGHIIADTITINPKGTITDPDVAGAA